MLDKKSINVISTDKPIRGIDDSEKTYEEALKMIERMEEVDYYKEPIDKLRETA
ncbi:hypothetical protein FACS189499_10020 [Clostridia bacterium]|nr:hypothetical protein FACS189499_10020 [Clostridia bacterium]